MSCLSLSTFVDACCSPAFYDIIIFIVIFTIIILIILLILFVLVVFVVVILAYRGSRPSRRSSSCTAHGELPNAEKRATCAYQCCTAWLETTEN